MQVEIKHLWIVAGAAVGIALLWAWTRSAGSDKPAQGFGEALGGAVGGAAVGAVKGVVTSVASGVDDLAAGAIVGVGKWVGIPETNMTECEKAMREGRTWDASFACPASDFVKYVLR